MSDYHHGNLREALIQAGDEELKLHGPENFSLREISRRAGVSHNAPYRHFRDKVELIDHILERTLASIADQIITAPMLYPVSVLLQIQYVGRLWAQLAVHHPRKAHLLFTGLSQPVEHKNIIQATYQLIHLNLTSILEAAQGQEIRTDMNCASLALQFLAAFRGLGAMYTSRATEGLITSESDLYDLSDSLAENILLSNQP